MARTRRAAGFEKEEDAGLEEDEGYRPPASRKTRRGTTRR
jgi:hypothetical protein